MLRQTLCCLVALACLTSAQAQLVITEIMYNPPEGGTDSLEYIEIHNAGSATVDLTGYTLTLSSNSNNPDALVGSIPAGGFYVSAVNARAFQTVFGQAPSMETMFGGLRNGGDRTLTLQDASGTTLDEVTYQNSGDWPTEAAGNGPSIELCEVTADNSDGGNWSASTVSTGVIINGNEVLGSPFAFTAGACGGTTGPTVYVPRAIIDVIGIDADGQLDSIGATAELTGIVNSPDFSGGASSEFFMQDQTAGIRVAGLDSDYMPMVGDQIVVRGTVEQRNGIAQFAADSIGVISMGNNITVVTTSSIDESNQGELITLANVSVIDSTAWQTSGSFNVQVTDGTNQYTLRIDADTDITGLEYPTGTFDVTGIATQFDNSSPYDEGYQLLPRSASDFAPYVPGSGQVFPLYEIAILTTENADGIADSLGVRARVQGTVIGFDLNGTGLLFTIVDGDGNGIALYSPTEDFNYIAREGDGVIAEGEITQFNGLTQLEISDLDFQSSNNPLPSPQVVTDLGEDTESRLVQLNGVRFADVSQWRGNGSSFNIDVVTSTGDTLALRIDDEGELANAMAPDAGQTYNVIGIGGQFDRERPLTEGYQLFPRFTTDLELSSSTTQVDAAEFFKVLRSGDGITIKPSHLLSEVRVLSVSGQVLAKAAQLNQPLEVVLSSAHSIVIISAQDMQGRSAVLKFAR